MASVQFSRGCPFLCEFCDIITIFGRRPRLKTNEQMIAEFEAVRAQGFHRCFLVDDNFIGNKGKAKELLRVMIEWQKKNGYPLKFVTEASINLADDAELMALMVEANIVNVFVGIPYLEHVDEIPDAFEFEIMAPERPWRPYELHLTRGIVCRKAQWACVSPAPCAKP
jgi:radical SAM superfamily enzyme YgiQ (UPF0313 family)